MTTANRKILLVYGTRPEAIKMAPLVRALKATAGTTPVVAVTGQHRAILDQVNELFDIDPAHDLDLLAPGQSLHDITARSLRGIADILAIEQPDATVIQGDTTTAFAGALASFYSQIPVVHLEAGLRTGEIGNPFPEEANRKMTSSLTTVHLAPTADARANLLAEGIDPRTVRVTGNTVIDALLDITGRRLPSAHPAIRAIAGRRAVLVTTHRRESWGDPMRQTAAAVAHLASRFPDVHWLIPVHPNPLVRDVLVPALETFPNVILSEPLGYADFAAALSYCELVLTDSGGVQEEAPSLGKPVLVLRDTTERPEAVSAGTVRLVGTDPVRIIAEAARLLTDPLVREQMSRAINPYGDGHAARRAAQAIAHHFGLADPPLEFVPETGATSSPQYRRAHAIRS